ncbi:MAG: alkaline phosphatase family protein [Candidatus Aenigmatarchaeota archaeon]
MADRVLVVAFDGLDRELIDEFGLEEIKMQEYGEIDNDTGISKRMTSELFTTFITGKTHEEHGIKGLSQDESDRDLVSKIPKSIRYRLKKSERLMEAAGALLGWENQDIYTRDQIRCDTLFDEISNSKDLNIPVYSENTYMERMFLGFRLGFGSDVVERDLEAEHDKRKKETMNAISEGYDFLMSHFFYPDTFQHLYEGTDNEKENLREMYEQMDRLAGKIRRNAKYAGFDTIIFISDHGRPTKSAHNTNAFYSSNKELYQKNPRMKDFYEDILQISGQDG